MDQDECECGSTEMLSKHISVYTATISLTEPMCEECRKEIRSSVNGMIAQIQPWWNPNEVQREIIEGFLKEGEQE